jgi:hypothetical protein
MAITQRSYYDAAEKGRQDKQASQVNMLRQKAAQQQLDQDNVLGTLMKDPASTPEQFARAGRPDIGYSIDKMQNAPREQQAAQAKQFAEQMQMAAQYGLSSKTPKALIEKNFPMLVEMYGPEWATATDDQVRGELEGFAARFGTMAGIGPPVPKERGLINTVGPNGQPVRGPDVPGAPVYVEPKKGPARFRAMAPQELATYGLPPGSSAQINDETGAVQVLNKPSVAPQQTAAERKAVLEAKVKMPRVAAAKRRALRLSQAVESIGKNSFFDGGPADAKTLQYTEQGRELIASAAQLMPELQALTRVPGIGSQSDLEARLASLALPSLEMDPNTNARSMAELQAFIDDLEAAYSTAAAGGQVADVPEEAGPAVVGPAGPSLDDIRKKYGR